MRVTSMRRAVLRSTTPSSMRSEPGGTLLWRKCACSPSRLSFRFDLIQYLMLMARMWIELNLKVNKLYNLPSPQIMAATRDELVVIQAQLEQQLRNIREQRYMEIERVMRTCEGGSETEACPAFDCSMCPTFSIGNTWCVKICIKQII